MRERGKKMKSCDKNVGYGKNEKASEKRRRKGDDNTQVQSN